MQREKSFDIFSDAAILSIYTMRLFQKRSESIFFMDKKTYFSSNQVKRNTNNNFCKIVFRHCVFSNEHSKMETSRLILRLCIHKGTSVEIAL